MEKHRRSSAIREVVLRTPKEYIETVTVHHEIQITQWCFAVMAVCTAAFLATWFLWGFNMMPNMTENRVIWFGRATLGIIGGAFTTIIAAKLRRRR